MVPNFQIYKSRNLTPQRAAHWKKEGQGFNLHLWWIIKGWIFGGLNIWCRLSRQDSIHHLRLGSSGFQNLAILLQTFARHHMMTDINELIFLGWFNYHYNSSNKKLLQSFEFFMEKQTIDIHCIFCSIFFYHEQIFRWCSCLLFWSNSRKIHFFCFRKYSLVPNW